MLWEKSSRAEKAVVIWALALASVALLVVLVAFGSAVSDNSSNVASWVQAVGSIAAIAAGFRVARFQVEEQRREQRARDAEIERQTKRKQCALLFERYASLVALAETSIELNEKGFPHWAKTRKELRRIQRVFDVLGVEDLAEAEDFWNAAHVCEQIHSLLESLGDNPVITFVDSAHREATVVQLQKLAESANRVSDEIGERLSALTTSLENELILKRAEVLRHRG